MWVKDACRVVVAVAGEGAGVAWKSVAESVEDVCKTARQHTPGSQAAAAGRRRRLRSACSRRLLVCCC